MSGRLVILDRDGVINHDSDAFVKSPSEWLPIDGSIEAIAELSNAGFTVAVATNQSGIGRKLLDMPTLEAIHKKMRQAVTDAGGDRGRLSSAHTTRTTTATAGNPAPACLRSWRDNTARPSTACRWLVIRNVTLWLPRRSPADRYLY